MKWYIDYIRAKLDERALLEQLAEEAVEVSKAALKLIRAKGYSGNVTPISAETARVDLNEEIMDLIAVLYALGYKVVTAEVGRYWKWKRWAERLGYKDEDGEKSI